MLPGKTMQELRNYYFKDGGKNPRGVIKPEDYAALKKMCFDEENEDSKGEFDATLWKGREEEVKFIIGNRAESEMYNILEADCPGAGDKVHWDYDLN